MGLHHMEEASTSYIVHVRTGDRFGAGTDANVFVQLKGKNGHSAILPLSNDHSWRQGEFGHKNKFERNQLDKFIFRNVESVGVVEEIQIWHDNRGLAAPWMLEYVEVSDPALRLTFRFPCHRWLKKTKEDGDTTLLLLKCTEACRGPGSIVQPALGVLKCMDAVVHAAMHATMHKTSFQETRIEQSQEVRLRSHSANGMVYLQFLVTRTEQAN